jgi:L-lysine exporter family protein LysE/ArgO
LNQLLKLNPSLQIWITCFGVAFLLYYAIKSFRQALIIKKTDEALAPKNTNRLQIIFLALGFSLLNPHAVIDSLVIIGSGSSQYPDNQQAFLLGVLSASFSWFFSLTVTTRYFADILARAAVWRRIEFSSSMLMFFLGLKLAKTLL